MFRRPQIPSTPSMPPGRIKTASTRPMFRIIILSLVLSVLALAIPLVWPMSPGYLYLLMLALALDYGISLFVLRRYLIRHSAADDALTQERNLLRTLIDHLPENIYIKDRDGRFLINNAQSRRVLKVRLQEDLLGKTDFDFFPAEMAERWRADEQAVMASGESRLEMEQAQPWREDERRWLISSLIPLHDSQGRVIGLLGLDRDITQRKRMEEALRESETRYRIVSELISDYAYSYDVNPDGNFVCSWMTEDSFRRLTGYSWSEIGATFKLYHPDDVEAAQNHVNQTLQGQTTQGEYRILTKSGEQKWLYIRRQPEFDSETHLVCRYFGVAQDITERKRLEEELQRYAQQLELRVEERTGELRRAKEQIEIILNNITDAIALARRSGDIQTSNPAFRKMFGSRVTNSIENLLWTLSETRQVETVASALTAALYDHEDRRTEAHIVTEDGREMDIDLALTTIREIDGEDSAILLSAHDITYLKEIERFKTQFVANAVHDLSNPIAALGTRLYLLKKTPEQLAEHVRILEIQIRHLRELVLDLRSLSELDRGLLSLNLESINLNDLVADVFEQYEPLSLSKEQIISFQPGQNIPPSMIDRRKWERVITNLISNAINYTPAGKQIWVKTEFDSDSLIFSVQDQGIGIAPEDLPHVFERFYRSDRAKTVHNTGTGLGLAIVKEMVVAHGGTISVQSELDQGSTFTVCFPYKPA